MDYFQKTAFIMRAKQECAIDKTPAQRTDASLDAADEFSGTRAVVVLADEHRSTFFQRSFTCAIDTLECMYGDRRLVSANDESLGPIVTGALEVGKEHGMLAVRRPDGSLVAHIHDESQDTDISDAPAASPLADESTGVREAYTCLSDALSAVVETAAEVETTEVVSMDDLVP